MLDKTYAVIMAGGKGERFWPMSTSKHPKQVLSLVSDKPLLSLAVEQLKGLIPPERVLIITNADLVEVTRKTIPTLPPENVIGEPFGRDTAAACALASALVEARKPGSAFCILTADHIISDIKLFQATLKQAFEIALSDNILVTIGIQPTFPSTGYGYIETSDPIDSKGDIDFLKTTRFVEKPDIETASDYIAKGNFYWNSGMFIWSVESFHKALANHTPQLMHMAKKMIPVANTPAFESQLKSEYEKLERISIDYAIMEKADNIVMAKGIFPWDDVGSWPALENHFDKDALGNVLVGSSEVIDSHKNVVFSKERLTALIGVRDLVVVQAENATLVCHKDRAQDVKKMVKLLEEKGTYNEAL
jgi:mannose-1-phosphate guanylyltransferase